MHARTDVGRVREHNEDSFLAVDLHTGRALKGRAPSGLGHGVLLAVCDGLGGAPGGDIASRVAVEALRQCFAHSPPAKTSGRRGLARQLREAIALANLRVRDEAAGRPGLDGMGTTLTAALIFGELALIGHVGDSRAYVMRSGVLKQATRDQSLGTALLDLGILSVEQFDAMHGANILLQAVGSDEELEIVVTEVSLCRGDVLLVCSDGLCGVVSEDEICDAIVRSRSMRSAAERLVRLALDAGGPDNVTVVLCRVDAGFPSPSDRVVRVDTVEG